MSAQASQGGSTKAASRGHHRLHRGVLGPVDIAAATMANIGPAMSFFFGFGLVATTAGVASPLTILAALVAVALLGNTLAEFTRALPSTGGFITFIGSTFGGRVGVMTALLTGAGYIAAMASVVAIAGGFFQYLLQTYHVSGLQGVPWLVWTVLFLAFAAAMMARGVKVSTKLAGAFFAVEMAVLVSVSIATLVKFHGQLHWTPFEPSYVTRGFAGLAAGFPLAVYLFIGWENSAALAEETDQPRRNVPRAVFASIAIMGASYLLFAYSTVVGFGYDTGNMGAVTVPFLSVAHEVTAWLAFVGFLAGMTSTLGALIAGTNSQARLIFHAAREGLLPAPIGRVHPTRRTPVNALLVFLGISLAIIVGWGIGHLLGGAATSGSMSAFNFFYESSTFGTILILIVYALANLALPFFYLSHERRFRWGRHALLPAAGIAAIAVPLYYLAKPGQPDPYNWFPYAALALVVLAVAYATALVARDPGLGDRIGSLVADE